MELFKDTNIDFLGKKWPFIILSALLLLGGLGSLIVKGGPRYGIDFKGGALIYVKFAQAPPMEKLRSALGSRLPGGTPDIQEITGTNEVIVGTELHGDRSADEARKIIVDTLAQTFGQAGSGKLDLNNTSESDIANLIRLATQRGGQTLPEDQIVEGAKSVLRFRNSAPQSGLLRSVDQLAGQPGVTPQIIAALKEGAFVSPYAIRNTEVVGPKIGNDLRRQAVLATLYALAGMLVYIAMRFEWVSGVAAVIAVLHDTLVTVGLLSIFNFELSLTVVAALLTLVGYSMNDKIVVFDRVRENLRILKRESLPNLINISVNQTLSRTLLTGGLTFLCAVSLLIFGGPVLRGFSFAFVVGIIVGTYSSIFIATPIVILANRMIADRKKASAAVSAAPTRGRAPAK
ncbi:MAG TPA: protein translocase subunit SecF [Bryobacteraceae bacterium]|nr:protein translocase subunit SecF [Bryobacteraceae bacterium]